MFFSVLGQEPDICKGGKVENCLHDTRTLSQNLFSMSFFGFGQEPDICKGGVSKVENCLHDTSTLSQNPFFSSVLARMQQN